MQKEIMVSSETIKLIRRDITQQELEKITANMALDTFRNIGNGGKIWRDKNDHNKGVINIYKTIDDIPSKYYDEFMDNYSSVKDFFGKSSCNAYDTPEGVFITLVRLELQTYDGNGVLNKSVNKLVAEWFISKNGETKNVEGLDFLT